VGPTPRRLEEAVAQDALREALQSKCFGSSWRGLVRGLVWRLSGEGALGVVDGLAEAGEKLFAMLIDDALWEVELVAAAGYRDFLEARPGDREGALAAARLDAREESALRVEAVCQRVVETLLTAARPAA
jgi:hypothetical protein